MDPRTLRRTFAAELVTGLRVVWPILSGLLLLVVALGTLVGMLEDWPLRDSLYFAFVTGLTIGYGDVVPKLLASRILAVTIGLCGVLITALVAAVAVRALPAARGERDGQDS